MSTMPVMPNSKFIFFKDLAPELRDKIWSYALADVGRRIIKVKAARYRFGGECKKHPSGRLEMKGSCKVPALIHVNREAREKAQTIYQLSFGTQLDGKPNYINFDKDVLVFTEYEFLDIFRQLGEIVKSKKSSRFVEELVIFNVWDQTIARFCYNQMFMSLFGFWEYEGRKKMGTLPKITFARTLEDVNFLR